jgi:hypothetical protein
MCNSVVTVGPVACIVCETDITESINDDFRRDPVQTYRQYKCPHCQSLLDVEILPIPYFRLSMPVGRIVKPPQKNRKGVYCVLCTGVVGFSDMRPFRKDDDTVDMLCPGCGTVLVAGE